MSYTAHSANRYRIGRVIVSGIALGVFASGAQAEQILTIPLEDAAPTEFWSFGGPTSNPNGVFDLGEGVPVIVTGLGWDLSVTAESGALVSDVGLGFASFDDIAGTQLLLAIADGNDVGGQMDISSGGILLLANFGIPDGQLPSGLLYAELFDWVPSLPGLTVSGSVQIQYSVVPAPGGGAMLGLCGLACVRRRR